MPDELYYMKNAKAIRRTNHPMFNLNRLSKLTGKFIKMSVIAVIFAFGANLYTVFRRWENFQEPKSLPTFAGELSSVKTIEDLTFTSSKIDS